MGGGEVMKMEGSVACAGNDWEKARGRR